MEADERPLNETSPLVGPHRTSDDSDVESVTVVDPVTGLRCENTHSVSETKSSWYLFLLTLGIGGLQIVWSVELSSGSPYLLSLGMSKALLAFVWIAGPITGTLVQPYIGIRSDNCRIPWGKRKPFMVVGGAATVVTLLALAWVREIVGGVLGVFGADSNSAGTKTVIIVLATMLMWCLDFAINTVQAAIRCFIVDNAPAHQQESANAWASRLVGIGSIMGYILGYIDLPNIFPFLGYTRFQVLCALASLSLAVTLFISCMYIQERDPRLDGPPPPGNLGFVAFFKQVFKSIKNLPPQAAKVCKVQVAAWIAWFPFLFYATTFIGQLYVNPIFEDHTGLSDPDIDKAWDDATRVGTFALLIYAIISFIANITLPLLVIPTYTTDPSSGPTRTGYRAEGEPCLGAQGISSSTVSAGSLPESSSNATTIKGEKSAAWLLRLQIPGFTLRRAWLFSHILFAICMFSTFFIYSVNAGTIVIALVGVSWAVTQWAPFALISAEVACIEEARRMRRHYSERTEYDDRREMTYDTHADPASIGDDIEGGAALRSCSASPNREENLAQAGIVLGLHNVAVSAPQILSSLFCSAIFKVFQKPRGEPGDDSVGWVLRFGGCAALLAAWLTSRLAEDRRGPS